MTRLPAKLRDWLRPRCTAADRIGAFLEKPLPRNVGWLHTLGSLLLVYLGFQFLTGMLLGFYYSASPDSAYASVRFIREQLFLGRFLHHLHRYGAGFIMVTLFLHLARSYFLAAYKKPRELLWLSGLALAVLITLFAFTGQLLPYDQRGYWATVVGIRIASSAPGVGDVVRALLTGGYGDIGAVTLSRFYILHVCVLPLTLAALIGVHIAILQHTGPAGPPEGDPRPYRPFFPHQAVRDVLVAAAGSAVLFVVAALVNSTDTGPADPAAAGFTPRPEWYFFAHYEILRFLPGRWQIVGTFVLPNLLLLTLVLLPFVDRSPKRSIRQRPLATLAGLLVGGLIVALTIVGVASASRGGTQATAAAGRDPVAWGRVLFRSHKCIQCHTIAGEGGHKGPDLTHVASRLRADYLPDWIRNPRRIKPDTEMPAFEGSEDELKAIVEYLLTLK